MKSAFLSLLTLSPPTDSHCPGGGCVGKGDQEDHQQALSRARDGVGRSGAEELLLPSLGPRVWH